MRNRYFRMYESIKFKECFYALHFVRAKKLYTCFSVVTLFISISSVLAWTISRNMPTFWAIVIAVAQFAQCISPYTPWSAQLTALKFLLPEVSKLTLEIDHEWLFIDERNYNDEKILELIICFEDRLHEIEYQFADGIYFSRCAQVLKDAEKRQRTHFYSRYSISALTEEGGEHSNAG
ncbi:MAG: hypothetical protein HFH26_14890 [Clostridiaceae bacterium]|nr:hypothetical protein [Clostridiaceae bacterium]